MNKQTSYIVSFGGNGPCNFVGHIEAFWWGPNEPTVRKLPGLACDRFYCRLSEQDECVAGDSIDPLADLEARVAAIESLVTAPRQVPKCKHGHSHYCGFCGVVK